MLLIDEDNLIARAKKAYYATANREADRLGLPSRAIDQLPDRGWEVTDEDGKVAVVCYHGDKPAVRYRFDGSRLRRLSPH